MGDKDSSGGGLVVKGNINRWLVVLSVIFSSLSLRSRSHGGLPPLAGGGE